MEIRRTPSPTRPPDPCAITAISITDVPQQRRYWNREIIRWGEAQSAPISLELTARTPFLCRNAAIMISSFIICLCKHCLCKHCSFNKIIDVLHVHLGGGRQAECRALSLGGKNRSAGFRSQRVGAGSDGKGRR